MNNSKKGNAPKKLNATEAIYAFTSWLTTRDKPIILSAHHNASVLPPLVDAFRTKHELPAVRAHYGDLIQNMGTTLDKATNDPALATIPCTRMYNAQEALNVVMPIILGLTPAAQTTVMAKLLLNVKDQHQRKLEACDQTIGNLRDDLAKEAKFLAQLHKIAQGEVVII